VTENEMQTEDLPRGFHEWLSRPGLTDAAYLQLVRVRMPPGKGHGFHYHPPMEEIIYVESGQAEQWLEQEARVLTAGQLAHIPKNLVHATFNASAEQTLVFLAMLSPAEFEGPGMVDVSQQQPWCELKPTNEAGDIL
jgi:quercetin dioxygenase-like cupin family protein